ncbi:Hypothetical protein NTJ_09876 [Nesidiocoris tenuis]|uniref:Uncharacterized protein n=1 Tax=Nesidiocoris tenuis TaxID=355587 RepID=A0ABN7AY29_9HEMI|nr:Hypothetical protein NTJ_09876 [Nesidiocoris tenuis]
MPLFERNTVHSPDLPWFVHEKDHGALLVHLPSTKVGPLVAGRRVNEDGGKDSAEDRKSLVERVNCEWRKGTESLDPSPVATHARESEEKRREIPRRTGEDRLSKKVNRAITGFRVAQLPVSPGAFLCVLTKEMARVELWEGQKKMRTSAVEQDGPSLPSLSISLDVGL